MRERVVFSALIFDDVAALSGEKRAGQWGEEPQAGDGRDDFDVSPDLLRVPWNW